MPAGIGDDSAARSARAGRRPACGPMVGAGAAQTRQIAHPDARDRGINHLGDKAALEQYGEPRERERDQEEHHHHPAEDREGVGFAGARDR